MSFDLDGMRAAVAAHGRVARVVVAETSGSVPREVGAAMLVWPGGQSGTIGGGALEFAAAERALAVPRDLVDRVPLGPGLGQCCGGAVTLLTEWWDAARLDGLGDVVVRPMPGAAPEMPLAVSRLLRNGRNGSGALQPVAMKGWMIEPVRRARQDLWLWGAGHVGRAIAGVMAPLPDWHVTWLDTARDRFPEAIPLGVTPRFAPDPALLAPEAPAGAHHLILTYSHALDLELCNRLLRQPCGSIGLIGSATKWARFRKRLLALGHPAPDLIRCPIGDPSLGKHPQAIALGVATALMRPAQTTAHEVRA